jgi:DNA-binding MarR family transcriptional regulator
MTDLLNNSSSKEGLPPAAEAVIDPGAAEVLELARALARGLEALRRAQAQAGGLRPPALALLEVLALAGPDGATVSEAAGKIGVRPQALPSVAGELEQAGLLSRLTDPADGRAKRLTLTPAGLERWQAAQAPCAAVLRQILTQVPHASVAKLVLGRLALAVNLGLTGAADEVQDHVHDKFEDESLPTPA